MQKTSEVFFRLDGSFHLQLRRGRDRRGCTVAVISARGGLNFVTCKEVSSYLLSLHGIQDSYQNSVPQPNEKAGGSDKSTTMSVADATVIEVVGDKHPVSCRSLPAIDSASDDHQMPAIIAADSVDPTLFNGADSVDPILLDGSGVQDYIRKGSIRSDNAVEVCDGSSGISLLSNDNAHAGESKTANRTIAEANESSVVTTRCSVNESDGDKSFHEGGKVKCSDDRMLSACSYFHETESESCHRFLDNRAASHVDKNFAPPEKPESNIALESGPLNSSNHVEVSDTVGIDAGICGTRNDFKERLKNIRDSEHVFDFLGSRDDQRSGFCDGLTQSTNFSFSTSPPQDGKEHTEGNVASLTGKHSDETYSSVISEKGGFNVADASLTGRENIMYTSSSYIPSPNNQRCMSKEFDSKAFACQHKDPLVLTTSVSRLGGSLAGHNGNGGEENNYDALCGEEMRVAGSNRAQNFGNCNLSNYFNSSDGALFSNSGASAKITTFSSSMEECQQSKLNENGTGLYSNSHLSEAYTGISSTPGDQNKVKPFDIGLSASLFSNRTHIAFNKDHPGQDWCHNGGGKIGSSGQNSKPCFANESSHSSLNVMNHGPWSTDQVFQDYFGATPNPQHQPSSLLTFGFTSHKTGEGACDVRTNYDDGTNMLGSTPNELVEYSFMSEDTPSSLPIESKPLSCARNPELDQGSQPPFWLTNDALMPHSAHNNKNWPTSLICAWCRNVFIDDGSSECAICPSCCSKSTGQFKLL